MISLPAVPGGVEDVGEMIPSEKVLGLDHVHLLPPGRKEPEDDLKGHYSCHYSGKEPDGTGPFLGSDVYQGLADPHKRQRSGYLEQSYKETDQNPPPCGAAQHHGCAKAGGYAFHFILPEARLLSRNPPVFVNRPARFPQ